MHFQIYLPGAHGADAGQLDRVGLADLRTDAQFVAAAEGPDGQGGMVVSWPQSAGDPHGYRPDSQTWVPAAPHGDRPGKRYWVGFWNESPPEPDDLARAEPLNGYWVELGDGNRWAVPVAAWLPGPIGLDYETGEKRPTIDARYREFFDRSHAWYTSLMTAEADAESINAPEKYWDYCVDALRLNYRLTQEVVAHRGLITTANWIRIVLSTLEGQAILEASQQKKSTGGSAPRDTDSTSPGAKDS